MLFQDLVLTGEVFNQQLEFGEYLWFIPMNKTVIGKRKIKELTRYVSVNLDKVQLTQL